VSNAIKYTDEGGRVRVELEATDDAVTVRVADTGRGIDPALRDELFEPFEQGDVRDEGGTGLGLAITKRLVGLMGGTIEVDSTPGDGSVFAIEVPRWVDA
jgi:signal transduction histidine kinase